MATATIIANHAPYYLVEVSFDGLIFVQEIVSSLTGVALETLLANYAADYQANYVAEV